MRELPTGTVTLLFTDIEGSTHLLQQLGERYADVLAECRHLLRDAFQHWNGYEVDTQGDAFFVAFARASDAVSAAVDGPTRARYPCLAERRGSSGCAWDCIRGSRNLP